MVVSQIGLKTVEKSEVVPAVGIENHRGIDEPDMGVEEKDERSALKGHELQQIFGKDVRFLEKFFPEQMGHEAFRTQIFFPLFPKLFLVWRQ
jgi:hypothetical protein